MLSPGYGYIQANVQTMPPAQEALNHVLVQLQAGAPAFAPGGIQVLPNSSTPVGSSSICTPLSVCGSVFSVNIGNGTSTTDYSAVAGVDLGTHALTGQQTLYTFAQPCAVPPVDFGPSSNGAVRIVSSFEVLTVDMPLAIGGAAFGVLVPAAASLLGSFASGSAALDPISLTLTFLNPVAGAVNIDTLQLYYNDGLLFQGADASSRYFGSVPLYPFLCGTGTNPCSNLSASIQQSPDFQELIVETLQANRQAVINYFNVPGNPNTSYTPPAPWQAIDCGALLVAGGNYSTLCPNNTYFGIGSTAASQVDNPKLFPCVPQQGALSGTLFPAGLAGTLPGSLNLAGVECEFIFQASNGLNLNEAFGRVGYNFTVLPTVNAQFGVTNISLVGKTYDIYQWNPAMGALDKDFANIQAGFGSFSSSAGQIFVTTVQIDTPSLSGFSYTIK
jgi:hypothetical protein